MEKKYIILLSVLLFISCDDENLNNIADNQFVVEAFLFAGQPVDDIRIKTTFPLSVEDDTSLPINNAQVTLIKEGARFQLSSSDSEGNYQYTGDDLTVETGDTFELEIIANGITSTATTTVPTPTTGLSISQDTIKVPQLPLTSGMAAIVMTIQEFLQESNIEAQWDNPDEDLYFMVVENADDTFIPIFPQQVLDALETFRFVSEPTDESRLTFLAGTLVSFGSYTVEVFHINQEYADLYENRAQDSRDLNEPPSNINNGLGVFSAFNSDSRTFYVVPERQ